MKKIVFFIMFLVVFGALIANREIEAGNEKKIEEDKNSVTNSISNEDIIQSDDTAPYPTTLSVYIDEYLKSRDEYGLVEEQLKLFYLSGEDSETVHASKTDKGYEFFHNMDEIKVYDENGNLIEIETLEPTTMGEIRKAIANLNN